MTDSTRCRSEVARLKRLLRSGDATQISNIAATYRRAGKFRRAFAWWQRAAATEVIVRGLPKPVDDGSALLELGYCYQYGLGVRRDSNAASRAYRAAARSKWIDEFSREEALYHLAVAYLDRDNGSRSRSLATQLLREAAADGDYPQATDLLSRLGTGAPLSVCRCRRGLRRSEAGCSARCTRDIGVNSDVAYVPPASDGLPRIHTSRKSPLLRSCLFRAKHGHSGKWQQHWPVRVRTSVSGSIQRSSSNVLRD